MRLNLQILNIELHDIS